jgi:hypothetical protein
LSSTFSIGGIDGVDPVARIACSKLHLLLAAGVELHPQVVGVDDLGIALQVFHLPDLHQLAGAAGVLLDDVVLEGAQLGEIDRRLAEVHAPGLRVARFVDQLGDVQQRLRRDAATVDADAARVRLRIDQRDAEAEIGGKKRGRVAPGPGADDDELDCGHKRAGGAGRAGEVARGFSTSLTCPTCPARRLCLTLAATVRRVVPEPPPPSAGSGSRRRRR